MEGVHIEVELKEGTTMRERAEQALGEIEKTYRTGPIIGDAREPMLDLLINQFARDYALMSMGLPKEKIAGVIERQIAGMQTYDAELRARRAELKLKQLAPHA